MDSLRQQSTNLASRYVDEHDIFRRSNRSLDESRIASPSRSNPVQIRGKNDLETTRQSKTFTSPVSAVEAGWWTPQQSPQSSQIYSDQGVSSHPNHWALPTPPRSDSGFFSVSIDIKEDYSSSSASRSPDFVLSPTTDATEMSSLGFLLPSQYGSSMYDTETHQYTMDSSYVPPMRMAQSNSGASMPVYTTTAANPSATTTSSNPELYQTRGILNPAPDPVDARRSHDMAMANEYTYRRISQPYEPSPAHGYPAASGPTIPSISGLQHNQMASPPLGAHFAPHATRPPGSYDSPVYHAASFAPPVHLPHSYGGPAQQAQPPHPISYVSYPSPSMSDAVSKSPTGNHESGIRVLNPRPKPQCWDHGCNGRQFSTFSNLLRHQREKSGTAAKSYCPKCGAEFTRTTARNGHLAHDKCTKQRRLSDGGKS